MTEYQDKLSGFAARLKTEEIRTPIQEVKPLIKTGRHTEPEIQLNLWIPKSLMKQIKLKSLNAELSIKDWVTQIIKEKISDSPD